VRDLPTASIDELLRYDEEPRPEPAGRARRIWLLKTVLGAAALAALVVLAARAVGVGLPYPVVFTGLLALFVLSRVLGEVAAGRAAAPLPEPGQPGQPDSAERWQLSWPEPDGLLAAAHRWDNRLSWTASDADRFARNVQPLIGELADERLRQRHGLTRESDPARARELLGETVWAFLVAPVTRSPTPREIAAVASELEKL
jgi:hypothetical protein